MNIRPEAYTILLWIHKTKFIIFRGPYSTSMSLIFIFLSDSYGICEKSDILQNYSSLVSFFLGENIVPHIQQHRWCLSLWIQSNNDSLSESHALCICPCVCVSLGTGSRNTEHLKWSFTLALSCAGDNFLTQDVSNKKPESCVHKLSWWKQVNQNQCTSMQDLRHAGLLATFLFEIKEKLFPTTAPLQCTMGKT